VLVTCACGHQIEISEAAVMSEAGRIAVRRRRSHRGATPKVFECRWCHAEMRGRAALSLHERECAAKPDGFTGFTEADLDALRWTPPAS
jgi:hypothetical protein